MRIYIRNLFSLRTVFGIFVTPFAILLFLTFMFHMIGISGAMSFLAWLYVPLALVLAFLFLTTQMACRGCGRALSTTRLYGQQTVCRHCGTPTDKQIAENDAAARAAAARPVS